MGSLGLYLMEGNRIDSTPLFIKSGSDTISSWKQVQVQADLARSGTKLVFEAVSGKKHLSDIAIDDIKVSQSPVCCSEELSSLFPAFPSSLFSEARVHQRRKTP